MQNHVRKGLEHPIASVTFDVAFHVRYFVLVVYHQHVDSTDTEPTYMFKIAKAVEVAFTDRTNIVLI